MKEFNINYSVSRNFVVFEFLNVDVIFDNVIPLIPSDDLR